MQLVFKMKICRFVFTLIILQIINSGCADRNEKTKSSASNAKEATNYVFSNDTETLYQNNHPETTNTATRENVSPGKLKHDSAESVAQASQIESSFEDLVKPKAADDIIVKSNLEGVLNQGTLSTDPSDIGTLGVLLSDSASTDLHQLASSARTDSVNDAKQDKGPTANVTAPPPPPIVILPPSEVNKGQSPNQDHPQDQDLKSDSIASKPPQHHDQPQPPVVRAEPKILEQGPAKVEEKPRFVGTPPPGRVEEVVDQHSSEGFEKPSEPATLPSPQPAGHLDLPSSEIPQEEIPSFSEWTQKQLEEAEKKKGQNKTSNLSASRGPTPSKVRSKNYASPDCGAKIVASNPEAENPSGVLANSKDEYLINKCSTQRIWLIIELCEAVQAKKIELANFELFSSSPKDFSVYLSHNFPSRDWASVGQFTAKDERTVQSFNLQPHLFGKFLKVELNSHYGQEHFCCTSLIRVYGTSEFEVLETENEGHGATQDLDEDDEDEQPIGGDVGKPAKNLFGHATDAVYTIVRKAAEVLVKGGDKQNQNKTLEENNTTALIPAYHMHYCSTLRHLVVCNNCSEEFFDKVYHLLSCQSSDLKKLIESPFVFDGINNSHLCSLYGLDYISKRYASSPLRLPHEDQLDQAGYLAAMLPAEYISALCNILAVLEGKVVLNTSQAGQAFHGFSTGSISSHGKPDANIKKLLIEHHAPQTCSVDASFTLQPCQQQDSEERVIVNVDASTSFPANMPESSMPSLASEIKPTRTLTKEYVKDISSQEDFVPQVPVYKSSSVPDVSASVSTSHNLNHESSAVFNPEGLPANQPSLSTNVPEGKQESVGSDNPVLEAPPLERERDLADSAFGLDSGVPEDQDPSKDLDAIFMEMKALDNNEETSTESSPTFGSSATTPSSVVSQTRVPTQQAQKESVFLRLSNKIKALERNMSLSGQYLEELSRRYKKQEELSRGLNKAIVLLREEIRKSKDRELQRDSDLQFLRAQLVQLTAAIDSYQTEQDSWQHKAVVFSQHLVLIVVEVVMFGVVVWMCRRFPFDNASASSAGPQRKWSTGWRKASKSHSRQLRRRSSLDELISSDNFKKRRPSEEALQITGSYKDLLLQEENVIVVQGMDMSSQGIDSDSWLAVSSSRDQRRKRKRRKEGLVKSSSSNNLSQLEVKDNQTMTRKISAPLHSYSLPVDECGNDKVDPQSKFFDTSRIPMTESAGESISETALVPDAAVFSTINGSTGYRSVQVPTSFMKTATSIRNRRSHDLGEGQIPFHDLQPQEWRSNLEGDSGSSASGQSSRSKGLDSLEPVSVCSPSGNSGVKKKLPKKGGLKSMVKKFF